MDMYSMDQEQALQLLMDGGIFVLLNVPENTEFGIDMKIWKTGEKFRGIKMIPQGPHFIHYSATSKHRDVAPRSGFFHVFQKGELVAKKWDADKETISTEEVEEDILDELRCDIASLDEYLGPYPFDTLDKWISLSKHINGNVIARLTPDSSIISSALEMVRAEKENNRGTKQRWSKSRTDEERQEDLLPEMVPADGTQIKFTELPKERYPEGSSPSEISLHYLDSSYTLSHMICSYRYPTEFLGEIEFAFVCFLIGSSLDAFEQWTRLVQLTCSCDRAVSDYMEFYQEFLITLEAQLEEIPEDFLVDIVANNNVIYRSLRDFFTTLQLANRGINLSLKANATKLKTKLNEKFGWDFTNLHVEEDEDAPVIVVLDQ